MALTRKFLWISNTKMMQNTRYWVFLVDIIMECWYKAHSTTEDTMTYLKENISAAIRFGLSTVCRIADVGELSMSPDVRNLGRAASGFTHKLAGVVGAERATATDDTYVDYFEAEYEEALAMFKQVRADCDASHIHGIRIIVADFMAADKRLKAMAADGDISENLHWLKPIDKTNNWGRFILALAEAFNITVPTT